MKKLTVVALAFMMVMAFSFSAMAINPFNTPAQLGGQGLAGQTIELRANIAPYAILEVIQDESIFTDQPGINEIWLSGAPGIYANDGNIFEGMLLEAFDPNQMVESGMGGADTAVNAGMFTVVTNHPVSIELSFDFDSEDWFNSAETIIGVWDRTAAAGTSETAAFNANQVNVQNLFPGANIGRYVGVLGDASIEGLDVVTTIAHDFEYCTPRDYSVVVGFLLEEVCQEMAGTYRGDLELTVTADELIPA